MRQFLRVVRVMLLQLWIAATGLLAIVLLQSDNRAARRIAPFVGLAGQPAWIAFTYQADAIGALVLTLGYTLVWMGGCVKVLRGLP